MTDLMQALYDYIDEHCYRELLPREYYWHHQRVLAQAESALQSSLSEEQWSLFEEYMDLKVTCHDMELKAVFQATWKMARELR